MSNTAIFTTAIMAIALAFAPSPAQGQDARIGAVLSCRSIEDDSVRLACFDATVTALADGDIALSAPTEEALALAKQEAFGLSGQEAEAAMLGALAPSVSRSAPAPAPAEPVASGSPDDISVDQAVPDDVIQSPAPATPERAAPVETDPDRIVLQIERTVERPNGKLRFHMTNGQVWRQLDSKRVQIPDGGEEGLKAHIRRAALGSFLMRINDEGVSIRVRREE